MIRASRPAASAPDAHSTAHVDGSHAFLNGAPTYLWLETRQGEPAEVRVEAPAGWRVVTALRREGEGFLGSCS